MKLKSTKRVLGCAIVIALLTALGIRQARAADIFIRFKVTAPNTEKFHVTAGGWRHSDPWYLPSTGADVTGGEWSQWLDLSQWPWHGKMKRSGGIAEWPAMKLSVARVGSTAPMNGSAFDVQLADKPDENSVVISFTERSASDTIGFLVPNPLREHKAEFESGSQMAARHLSWAKAATGSTPVSVKKFDIITSLWGHYDPALARQEVEALRTLGFNVIGNVDASILRPLNLRAYGHEWLYSTDPEASTKMWQPWDEKIKKALSTDEGKWLYNSMAHFVLSDEVSTLDFRSPDMTKVNGWFRDYLRSKNVTDADLGKPIAQIEYPAAAMYEKTLPREADLPARRLMYHAAKFGQWWSAKQLRHSSDLVHGTLPLMKTETLPTDHGFFNAWGPPHMGMSYRLLDLFDLGAQRSVDQLSAEDWMGLNHMYGPNYTWTGAQTFEYFSAIVRSASLEAPANQPVAIRNLITPSDDKYLRLKAYSGLAQGSKSFFFWTYGPTFIGTENYWSDLRSEYDGIAKLNRALAKSEDILASAQPVRDPVAILYSVSHDIWHNDDPAAFVEKRLLWHGLRHLHIQPDFLREETVIAGRLKNYKVLYITDWNISRAASAAIDEWVRAGGVLYLSAGAATRDEFNEPYVPPFAQTVWPDDAAQQMIIEKHNYNERTDLPTIKPMAKVELNLGERFSSIPVIGCRLNLRPGVAEAIGKFDDGATAGAVVRHGQGTVIGLGFMPMLAYGQGANFKPATLEEKWPAQPRELINIPLSVANVTSVAKANVPVVETSLLTGASGSALVLANYTYEPIKSLSIDVKLSGPIKRAVSTEGVTVKMTKILGGVRLELPLDWTDIILLPRK